MIMVYLGHEKVLCFCRPCSVLFLVLFLFVSFKEMAKRVNIRTVYTVHMYICCLLNICVVCVCVMMVECL